METKDCNNCIYFDKFKDQHREDNTIGACKYGPPYLPHTVVIMGKGIKYERDGSLGQWPLVLGSFWCGGFNSGENEK